MAELNHGLHLIEGKKLRDELQAEHVDFFGGCELGMGVILGVSPGGYDDVDGATLKLSLIHI